MDILELMDIQKLVDLFLHCIFLKNEVRQIERFIHHPILIFLNMVGLKQLHLLMVDITSCELK